MFELVGMGWDSLLPGVAIPGTTAVLVVRRRLAVARTDLASAWRRIALPATRPSSLRPLAFLSAASLAITTRILSLAYQTTSNGISVGSLAVWGDWSAHAAYAGSFAHRIVGVEATKGRVLLDFPHGEYVPVSGD